MLAATFRIVIVKTVKQMLCVDFISLIYNLVHVSIYILLLFSVNEVVEMEMFLCVLIASISLVGGTHKDQTYITEANKNYKMQSYIGYDFYR